MSAVTLLPGLKRTRSRAVVLALAVVLAAPGVSIAAEAGLFNADGYRTARYRRPLPKQPPAGRLLDTESLRRLIATRTPILVDVLAIPVRPETAEFGIAFLPAVPRYHIPGSHWLPNVGYGRLDPIMERYFSRQLQRLTRGDPKQPLVFYCITDCWMSWNAVKRADSLGYLNLYWYPDGSDGWAEAGLPLARGEPVPLDPRTPP